MNLPVNSPRVCPTCGSSIPEQAPAGLCPQCLLKAGLESGAAANPVVAATLPSPHSTSGFVPPEIAELAAKFPQLEILELLGKGGMGAVYKARQRGLDRFVAIKILPPEIGNDLAFAERFAREARALGKLNHPNIVSVYDFGRSGDQYYFLMEYVEGANLRQAIRSGSLTAKDALAIVSQVCDALQFAHDEGVVHRDIKPENILIDKRGRVKIADFGLAKLLGQDQTDQGLTQTHQVMGTLRYMAPEQMQGSKEVDHRADIFSLGVVFYELLTGELPVGRFAAPSKTVGVDVRLDEVVLRALEREPTLRYQHVSEVKTEVQAISGLSPAAVQNLFGREYRSKAEIFGWPLLHIAFGIDAKTGKRKVAKGVIAIGDTAVGGLAIGGSAIGVLACGGAALGLISLGGVSIGLLLAIGGCALGNLAFGGLAIGTVAVGGCAIGYYAYGGAAFGTYTVTSTFEHPTAVKLFENLTVSRQWPRWLMWLGVASPAAFGLLYVFIWLVFWSKNRTEALSAKESVAALPDIRQQIKNIGTVLVGLGVALLIFWLPLTLGVSAWADKANIEWVTPLFAIHTLYSLLAGAIVVRAGRNLQHYEAISFGQFALVLVMLPFSLIAIVGIPFGFWAWGVLSRREANLVVEEERRTREKEELAQRMSLRDQESMWHDLGVIVGYFLRNPTTQWMVGGAATLVYLICLILFFSFHGERITQDNVLVQKFSAGQPSPWFLVEASERGHRWSIQFISWANVVALIGIGALQVTRQIERLQTGKMHSMMWHYVIWSIMLMIVFTLGISTLNPLLPKPRNAKSNIVPESAAAAQVDRPSTLPEAKID